VHAAIGEPQRLAAIRQIEPMEALAAAHRPRYGVFVHNEFTAVIERAPEGGYWAYCPEIPGANGQGETVEECRANLREAIRLILEDRREDTSFSGICADMDAS